MGEYLRTARACASVGRFDRLSIVVANWQLKFISRQAEKGWIDALATSRNAIVDAWDRLTTDPLRDATPVTQKRLNASEA